MSGRIVPSGQNPGCMEASLSGGFIACKPPVGYRRVKPQKTHIMIQFYKFLKGSVQALLYPLCGPAELFLFKCVIHLPQHTGIKTVRPGSQFSGPHIIVTAMLRHIGHDAPKPQALGLKLCIQLFLQAFKPFLCFIINPVRHSSFLLRSQYPSV